MNPFITPLTLSGSPAELFSAASITSRPPPWAIQDKSLNDSSVANQPTTLDHTCKSSIPPTRRLGGQDVYLMCNITTREINIVRAQKIAPRPTCPV